MVEEFIPKLAHADLPADLTQELTDLIHVIARLWPSLPRIDQRWTRRWLERVIVEATEPATALHWWPVYLDLIGKTAQATAAGEPVVAATGRLFPLLWPRLGPYAEVSLQPITRETVRGICQLSDTLTEPRKAYVAPNAISLAQAHFSKYAWFRAIHAGKAPVGFMMILDDPDTPEYYLWRLMIGGPYQGRGYGSQAIRRLVEYVRTRPGAIELTVSCGEGEGSPKEFYLKQGFVSTGEVHDEELLLRMALTPTP